MACDNFENKPRLNPAVKETLAVHHGLCKLGFDPKDIWVSAQKIRDNLLMIFVIIEVQDSQFNIAIAGFDGSEEEFKEQWKATVDWSNNVATDQEIWEIWSTSKMYSIGPQEFCDQLTKRGIKVPILEESEDEKEELPN